MKKLTKLTALALTVMLLVSLLAACDIPMGSGSTETDTEPPKTDSTASESSKPTEAPTSAPTDEPTQAPTQAPTSSETEDATEGETEGGEKQDGEYTISVKTVGGRPIPNLTLFIYKGDDLVSYTQTNEDGTATVSLDPAEGYTVELPKASLTGYEVEDRYALEGNELEIILTSFVISDTNLTGVSYEVGDIMHDFTVTLTDGSTFTLSEV